MALLLPGHQLRQLVVCAFNRLRVANQDLRGGQGCEPDRKVSEMELDE